MGKIKLVLFIVIVAGFMTDIYAQCGSGSWISPTSPVGGATASNFRTPFRTATPDARFQYLYLRSEIGAIGAVNITSVGFFVENIDTNTMRSFNVSLRNSSVPALGTTSNWELGMIPYYTGTYKVTSLGWNMITLQTPFQYDGTSNLVIQVCWTNDTIGIANRTNTSVRYYVTQFSTLSNDNQGGWTVPENGCSTPYGGGSNNRPQFRFDYTIGNLAPTISPATATLGCTNTNTTLTASGGTTYAWSTGATTPSITVSSPNTYIVTVSNSSGCSATASASVTQNTTPPTASVSPASATLTCSSTSTSLTASGGGTYSWSTGATTNSINVNTSGNYTVTVTGSNGCTASASANVSTNTTPPTATVTPTSASITCSNPSATLTAGGGTSYSWSTGATTNSINTTTAANYIVTVTAANGCTATASAVVSGNTTPPTATVTPSSATLTCSNPTATLTAGGGTSYNWSTGATTSSINANTATTYTVTVTAANGCTATASAVVTQGQGLPTITFTPSSPSITCANPSVTITASGGDTYTWSTGATSSSISVNAASTYSVTATNNTSGCTASASVNVSQSPGVQISVSKTNTTCGNNNGSINASATTGNGTLSFSWSNGSTSPTLSNLPAGTYSLTVVDALTCSATASVIIEPSSNISIELTATKDTICAQDSTYICSPAGYDSYTWNTGATSRCIYASQAGNYRVTASDNSGCTVTSANKAVYVYPVPSVSILINGDTLATFNGLSYQWYLNGQPIPGATSSVYIAKVSGSYQVRLVDRGGCAVTSAPVQVTVTSIGFIGTPDITVHIFPNPNNSDTWYLEVNELLIGGALEVLDAGGRLVYNSTIQQKQSYFYAPLSNGVYFARIKTPLGAKTYKLLKL